MTRFMLASDDPDLEVYLRDVMGLPNGDLRRVSPTRLDFDLGRLVGHLIGGPGGAPQVVVVGPDLEVDSALDLAERIDELRPDTSVVLVNWPEPELLERALRSGVRDIVSPDAEPEDLASSITFAAETSSRRRDRLGAPRERVDRRIIAVVSPKGGSGKTTIASNLAVGLAQREPDAVALVDLDLAFGDVSTALGMSPDHTIAHAAAALTGEDDIAAKVFLTRHETGLHALCAPEAPEQAEVIDARQTTDIIRVLSNAFRVVIVDTPAGLDERTLAALEVATDIILLCTMDVPSVRSVAKLVLALEQLGFTHQRRHFVLNRAASKVGLDERDIAATIGAHIDVAIPSARVVPLSMNEGQPILAQKTTSPVSRRMTELVDRFAGLRPEAAQKSTSKWSALWA